VVSYNEANPDSVIAVSRIQCTECDNMILPETAAANGGMCGQCVKIPESIRRERRAFESKLTSGSWFVPSPEEWDAAKRSVELDDASVTWGPEPEFYKDRGSPWVRDLIEEAAREAKGDVFLVGSGGRRLNLGFNEVYGVCEYQNEQAGESLYAYSPENLSEQVAVDRHIVQACPCCGVGLLWYPSRFHMPRPVAFAVFAALALHEPSDALAQVSWLDCGDITWTARGRG
jgi:hypothetical protein